METYLEGMKGKEEEELTDALVDVEQIEGARIQMDFECGAAKDVYMYRRILGRIALCEKWLPQRKLWATAGGADSRWQQAALVEALARLEGVLGRLRDKAAKALAELKKCIGRMQKWHAYQTEDVAMIDKCTRNAHEARELVAAADEEEHRQENDRLLDLARVQDPNYEWFPYDRRRTRVVGFTKSGILLSILPT